jgi:hypothetical protein
LIGRKRMGEDGTGEGLFGGEPAAVVEPVDETFQVGEWAKDHSDAAQKMIRKGKWETPDAVYESYAALRENMDGIDRFKLPANADDSAGWDAAMTKLGMPETAAEYEFSKREEGQKDLGAEFRAWAREHRMPQSMATGLLDDLHKFHDTQSQIETDTFLAQRVAARTELAEFWGEEAKINESLAGKAAKQVFGMSDEMVTAFEKLVGTRETMEMFLRVAKDLGSHDGAGGGGGGEGDAVGGMSRSQAEARHAEIMASPEELSRFASGDPAINAEIQKLNAIIHGTAVLGVYDGGVPAS